MWQRSHGIARNFYPLLWFAVHAANAKHSWDSILTHGKMDGFPSYAQANSLLDSWQVKYSDFLEKQAIGHSILGRTIYAYSLWDRRNRQEDHTPEVLISSLMHAREPAGLTVVLHFLGRLLEQQEKGDPEAIYLLRMRRMWVVPFVNPDGYLANENLTNRVIRKNLRVTCSQTLSKSTLLHQSGVDLNRNFGYHWASTYDPCAEEYQGAKPFSEPETQAFKQLVEAHEFKTAINFHSYGGMLTHPFNFGRKSLPADDQVIYDELSRIFKWNKFGTAIETVGYTTQGESDDWLYHAHHIISMSPEVGPEGGGFWPPPAVVIGINERNYDRLLYATRKAGLELNVSWTHERNTDKIAQGVPQAPDSLLHVRLSNEGLTRTLGHALSIAVSGATDNMQSVRGMRSALVAMSHEDGPVAGRKVPVQIVADPRDSAGAPFVTFHVNPLERRSSAVLEVLLTKQLEATSSARQLRLCAVEVPETGFNLLAEPKPVCHCMVTAALPAAATPGQATVTAQAEAYLVSYNDALGVSSDFGVLCNAAVSGMTKMHLSAQPTKLLEMGALSAAGQEIEKHQTVLSNLNGDGAIAGLGIAACMVSLFLAVKAYHRGRQRREYFLHQDVNMQQASDYFEC
jgi:hypothetical protein